MKLIRYKKLQKWVGPVPAVPPEYKLGGYIEEKDWENIEDCLNSTDYEWILVPGYICEGELPETCFSYCAGNPSSLHPTATFVFNRDVEDTVRFNIMAGEHTECFNVKLTSLSSITANSFVPSEYEPHSSSPLYCLRLNDLITDEVTNMSGFVRGQGYLSALEMDKLKLPMVENLYSAFRGCSNMVIFNIPGLTSNRIADASYAFYGCENMTNLITPELDLNNTEDLSYMFYDCGKLEKLDIKTPITLEKTKNASHMFATSTYKKPVLENLDISVLNLIGNSELDASYMFEMEYVYSSSNYYNKDFNLIYKNFKDAKNLDYHNRCTQPYDMVLPKFTGESLESAVRAFYVSGTGGARSLSMPVFKGNKKLDMSNMIDNLGLCDYDNFEEARIINSPLFKPDEDGAVNLPKFKGTNLESATNMFNSSSYRSINAPLLRNENTLNGSNMFGENLETINIPNLQKVSNIVAMFTGNTSNLKKVVLTNMTTDETSLDSLFKESSYLTDLDITALTKCTHITNYNSMFEYCGRMKNFSGKINLENATSCANMFNHYAYLSTYPKDYPLEEDCFKNNDKFTTLASMFYYAKMFKDKKVKFTFSGTPSLASMFYYSDIEDVEIPNFTGETTSGYCDLSSMFRSCTSLKSVKMPKWNGWGKKDYMFSGCTALEYLDISECEYNYSKGGGYSSWFTNCNKLMHIKCRRSFAEYIQNTSYIIPDQLKAGGGCVWEITD